MKFPMWLKMLFTKEKAKTNHSEHHIKIRGICAVGEEPAWYEHTPISHLCDITKKQTVSINISNNIFIPPQSQYFN